MRPKWKNGIALSLLLQVILVKWLGKHPQLIEDYYSEGIYPAISKCLRLLTGWVPFSIGDLLYTLLSILTIRYLIKRWTWIRIRPISFLRDLMMVMALAYGIFHLYWGMNYYRLPINEKMNFEVGYTIEELTGFTNNLIELTNGLQMQLTNDSTQAVQMPYQTQEIYSKTFEGYRLAANIFPNLEFQHPSLKSSLFSWPLTYMGYGGYLNPFTNEAQVNDRVPKLRLPSISAHEVGHQLGYSSESSTNFIGLLVTSAHSDPYFRYAAQFHGLAYCLNELSAKSPQAYEELVRKIHPGVKKNFQELNEFWALHENPAEPIFKTIFDIFLKTNNQEQGIESYNQVVGLLIGFDRHYR